MEYKIESFSVLFDKDDILDDLQQEFARYTPLTFVRKGENADWGDSYLTENEYRENLQRFIDEVQAVDKTKLEQIVKTMPKKKNGKFWKNRVQHIASCDNALGILEWGTTWIYEELYVSVQDENTLVVRLRKITETEE